MRCFPTFATLALAVSTFGCRSEDDGPDYEAQVVEKLSEGLGRAELALFSEGPHEISKCLLGAWSFSSRPDGYTGSGFFSADIGNRCDEPVVIYGITDDGGGSGSLRANTSAGAVQWCSWNPEWNGTWKIIYLQPGEILSVGSVLHPHTLASEDDAPIGQVSITWPKPNGPKPGANCWSVDPDSWIVKTYNVELSDHADAFLSAELLAR